MCGLVGILGSGINNTDTKVLRQLIYVDSLRGHHSTGLAAVNGLGEISYFKKAVDGPDFLQMKPVDDLTKITNLVMFAHNRYATKGAKSSANAHPFEHDHIVLAHNGTLRSVANLPDYQLFDVDSDNLAYAFAKEGAEKVIPKINGAFALTWYDSKLKTFNIVRNEERPLCLVRHKTRDVVYYASERKMLEMVLERNDIDVGSFIEVGTGKWISYPISTSKVGEPTVTKIAVNKAPPPVVTTTYGNGYYQGRRHAYRTSDQILAELGLKAGDEIEFYSTGVEQYSAVSPSGTLKGTMTESPFSEVVSYQQPCRLVAGIYVGRVSTASELNGETKVCVVLPKMSCIIEGDANNDGKEAEVQALMKEIEEAQKKRSAA